MKRLLQLLLFLVCTIGICSASEQLEHNYFKYTKYTSEAVITDYTGSEQILLIPTILNETYITELGSIGTENTTIKTVYVPASISVASQALNKCKGLQTIILEQDNLKDADNSNGICYQDINTTITVKNITILGNCTHSIEYYIGGNAKNKYSRLLNISFTQSGQSPKSISMYIYGTSFKEQNLEALQEALILYTKDISTITAINFSEIDCGFESSFNPTSLFPNATITTTVKIYKTTHPLADDSPFVIPTNIEFEKYSYSRSNTVKWNSVCLPFPIKESMFPSGTMIYTLNETQGSENAISLKRIAGGETELSAGVPCYIKSTAESWSLTIPKANVTANVPAEPVTAEGWQIVGSFTEAAIAAGEYKLNTAGSAFGITTSNAKVYPYRCYLHKVGSSPSPARLSVSLEEPDGTTETVSIDEIMREQDEALSTAPQLYDLFGRPRSPGSAGIFVRPTRH